MIIHDPTYRDSPEAAEQARLEACLGSTPVPPVVSLVKTPSGRRVVLARLVRVAALRIATAGEVSREYLRTQFTAEEIDVCWPLAEPRLPPAIRDLAMAA